MKLIALDAIKVLPERQRQHFAEDLICELAESIKERSLQHAIVLRVVGDEYVLVSGERRLRAISDIYALGGNFSYDGEVIREGFVPYTLFSDLSPLAAEEAELEENIRRQDLSWQERAAAHARLNSLRTRQATASGEAPPTVADIAREVRGTAEGVHHEATRRELIVAKHLDNPAVKAAKSVDEAFKILKKEESSAKSRELGERVGRTFTAESHKALNEDSLEWMRQAPAEQFDVILTDPPYGMGADEFGDSGGLAERAHGYADTPELAMSCYKTLAWEGFRLAKAQAHLYAFCDIDLFPFIKTELAAAGWWVFRTPLIWHKPSGMRAPWPEHGPQRKYETLVYAVKGKKSVVKMAPDLVAYAPDKNLGHAAQKPAALYEDLLRRSCHAGDSVLDPFMGSGTIFSAAHPLKIAATGIELDTASFGIAVKRLEQLKVQGELIL